MSTDKGLRAQVCLWIIACALVLASPYPAAADQPSQAGGGAGSASAAGTAANLLTNSDFEQGLQGWQPDDALRRRGTFGVEQVRRRKSQVLRIENTSPTERVSLLQEVQVQPGKTYEVLGYCTASPLQESAGVALYCYDAQGKLFRRLWAVQIPTWGMKGWGRIWGQVRVPQETARAELRLVVFKKGSLAFDDLQLIPAQTRRWKPRAGEPVQDAGLAVRRYPTPRPVYSMDVDDLDGDGKPELLLANIDGHLLCQETAGTAAADARQVRWDFDLGGLAYDLDCGDLDGDGRKEIVACTADNQGHLRALSSQGKSLWTYALPGTLFHHVLVADVNGDGRAEVFATHDNKLVAFSPQGKVLWEGTFGGPRFRAITVGDTTGDGKPDIVASLTSQHIFAAAFDIAGKPLWRYNSLRHARLTTEDLCVADVNGDGKPEVLLACAGGLVLCLSKDQVLWEAPRERSKLWPHYPGLGANLHGAQSHLVVGDFCPDHPGLETLVCLVDSVWLLDSEGRYIWESPSGLLLRAMVPWRTPAAGAAGPPQVFIPSSGFRDPSVYRLTFVRGQGNALAEYSRPDPIYDRLGRLYDRLRALPALPEPPGVTGKFHVIFANLTWPTKKWGSFDRLREVHEFLKARQSKHLEYIFMLWPKDLPVELWRGGMVEQKEILQVAEFLEKLGQPFMFFADHGCAPNLSLDTIEKTFQVAPTTCRGMYVAENTGHYPGPKWDEFVDWAMKVMDLCRRYGGKKVVFKEMFDSWAVLPADPKVRETLLQPKYRDTIVALYATNNPIAPELQIGGMAGLKHAGLISDWGISTQYWNWSWSEGRTKQANWALCPPDVLLQMELSVPCLGGRWLHIEGGQDYLTRSSPPAITENAKRHRDLVYELMRKNLLLPVPDAWNASFSDFVLVARPLPDVQRMREEVRRGSWAVTAVGEGGTQPAFLGVGDALQTADPAYFPAYAYGCRRYVQSMAPPTPFGFVRIVPECNRTSAFLRDKLAVGTDGVNVFLGGKRWGARDAKPKVLALLRRAQKRLPVRAPGAAVYVHRLPDAWRVFLLDPGYLDPQGVTTMLQAPALGENFTATDLLLGETLRAQEGKLSVTVPPGAFRVLELRRNP
ncbi:MAG: VCBS repeat-containing protein [Armatimonadetes bacterium]|nr:VCBS repeat-containing protein [Armatimonadota bacterium]